MHSEPWPAAPSPDEAARALEDRPGLAWLDGDGRTELGRWSFVASDPVERVVVPFGADAPLAALRTLEPAQVDATPPFGPAPADVPAWIGFVAYDAAWSGRRDARHPRDARVPVLAFFRYEALVAYDHEGAQAFLVGDDAAACARLRARLGAGAADAPPRAEIGALHVGPAEEHAAAIERALEHVRAGDLYQVNLARRWTASFAGSPLALFRAMRAASPVPLGAFLDGGGFAIASRSMERFLRWDRASRRLETRPIKGTIARDEGLDEAARALRADEKERAEHTMIVDLMRNDLGRVAEPGSVRVARLFAVEPFARLAHLVSTVACTTRPEVDLESLLRATFPPGSVTGTPKVRAVATIEALEACAREVYTGAIGFVDRAGGLSLAVAIRTASIVGDEVRYHAGGGIVFGSEVGREIAETELKARAFSDAALALVTPRAPDAAPDGPHAPDEPGHAHDGPLAVAEPPGAPARSRES